MNRVSESVGESRTNRESSDGILLHENAEDMPALKDGAFARLDSGRLFMVAGKPASGYVSEDEGASWTERPLLSADSDLEASFTGCLVKATSGALILAFSNVNERHFTWEDDLRDAPGARLPTYAMRSLDEGNTWQDIQKLHDEWTGSLRCAICTRDGRAVFTTMKMLHNPGRHSVLTHGSDDDGVTWQASNIIDLGGNGHHGGISEGTIVELKDGRILHFLRTNWGQFWRALSADGGRTWHPYGPSGVDASSAPGALKRLASGRIALVWNRFYPEGQDTVPLQGGDGIWSATPTSNYREELSISFSEDETETWSPPVVIARNPGSEVSYPYVFEPRPGTLWITAHRWKLRMQIREDDLLR